MRRKLVAMVLALVVCLTLTPSVFATEEATSSKFTDVPGDAYYVQALDYAIRAGIVFGTSPTTFSPDLPVTKAQFVTMLGRTFKIDGNYEYWAEDNGYFIGSGVYADGAISVEQMACILDNYIRIEGLELIAYNPVTDVADMNEVSEWAEHSVSRVLWYGLIGVDSEGCINPTSDATRAMAVNAIVRLVWLLEDSVAVATYGETGVAYTDLFTDEYEFVPKHKVDDIQTVHNNIRYMLQQGLHELILAVREPGESEHWTGSAYGDVYWEELQHYPEFGLKYVWTEVLDNGKLRIEFTGYPQDYEALMEYQYDTLTAAVNIREELYVCGELSEDMTQLEKARVYYDWVVDHCEYDWESFHGGSRLPFAWMAYGPIIRGWATCQGYTAAYNLFMRLEGIECYTEKTPYHIWSVVELDGETYHIDATWSDMCDTEAEPYFAMLDASLVEGYRC